MKKGFLLARECRDLLTAMPRCRYPYPPLLVVPTKVIVSRLEHRAVLQVSEPASEA